MIGSEVLGYRIDSKLGEGGMGAVYVGVQDEIGQRVAIKVLDIELARNPEIRERFFQEARIQIALQHPGIVRVLSADTRSPQPALIMELVDGLSLAEVIRRRGPLPVDDAIAFASKILDAVGFAHNAGVVHRDLKPANVMVQADGSVKVMDFGIARVIGNTKLTRTGTTMGSADYMPPEQVLGKPVDARGDLYAIGCILFELLTGKPPFGGLDGGTDSDFMVKQAHVQATAPDVRSVRADVPPHVAAVLARALAKTPDDRFSSAAEFAAVLGSGVVLSAAKQEQPASEVPPRWAPAPSGVTSPTHLTDASSANGQDGSRRPKAPASSQAQLLQLIAVSTFLLVIFAMASSISERQIRQGRRARIDDGQAQAVIEEVEAIPERNRSPDDLIDLGLALIAVERRREGLSTLAQAHHDGSTDNDIVDGIITAFAFREGGDVELLGRWPKNIDGRLRGLLHKDWWPRHHALNALEKRGVATDDDRQKVGLIDVTADDCSSRKQGVLLLKQSGRGDEALAAVQKLSGQVSSNLCMMLDLQPAEDAIRRRSKE